jgi:hypothetical protein
VVAYSRGPTGRQAGKQGKQMTKGRGAAKGKDWKTKKDTKNDERSQEVIENKGQHSKNKPKTNWFLSAKNANQTQKRGQKTTFCDDSNRNLRLPRGRQVGEHKGAT